MRTAGEMAGSVAGAAVGVAESAYETVATAIPKGWSVRRGG